MPHYEACATIARITKAPGESAVPYVEQAILIPLMTAAFLNPVGYKLLGNNDRSVFLHDLEQQQTLNTLELTASMLGDGELILTTETNGNIVRLPRGKTGAEALVLENNIALFLTVWGQNQTAMIYFLHKMQDERFRFLKNQ